MTNCKILWLKSHPYFGTNQGETAKLVRESWDESDPDSFTSLDDKLANTPEGEWYRSQVKTTPVKIHRPNKT